MAVFWGEQYLGREPNERSIIKMPAAWKPFKASVPLLIREAITRRIITGRMPALPVKLGEVYPFYPPLLSTVSL